eukprot:14259961-Ditylum_brightwellii.AAC.1
MWSPQQSLANQEDKQWQRRHHKHQPHIKTMATQSIAVMEHFPVKEIWKQIGMSTWESIRATHIDLNVNAASVLRHLGGGIHGHLGLTIG